jgi:N6-L-threonylcarbamoyladenine synthase
MKILAIESSCDETAAAVVENGHSVLSNVVASQIDLHALTGGVVPEVASRAHVHAILPVIREALLEADCEWDDIDALAVTVEPGLVGSLLVGKMSAATLAYAHDKPLIPVNHVHGHWYSSWLEQEAAEFPILVLSISGKHNELVLIRDHGDFEVLGETLDDAAGEAFDKTSRLLGLGYPGGPAIEKEAEDGAPDFKFPSARIEGYDFSFSGLKTSVLYFVQKNPEAKKADIARAFQDAVVKSLVDKTAQAAEEFDVKEVHLVGGVSANKALRAALSERLGDKPFRHPAKMRYCTDNAAMIGAAAYWLQKAEKQVY